MPGKNSTPELPKSAQQRRRFLKCITPSAVQCAVPGCEHGRVWQDCCYEHSCTGTGQNDCLPNDGIIDWIAIDVATRGLRKVRLTWVEKDIAAGMIFARGGGVFKAQELIGARVCGSPNSRRVQAAWRIAEAIKRTSNKGIND